MEEAKSAHHDTAKIVAERLEVSRRELLDLGLRNPLLNYRLLRARGLEVVDEIPAQVFRLLVQEERAMAFHPRMHSEEDGQAAKPQENTTMESPAERHTDHRLQTDVLSDELQSRLLATYYAANSFVQEQGVNILYLALGMLTWYESDSSQEPRRAPLLLVPVNLTRSNVRDRFRLSYTGQDPGENLSLIEKTKSDFGVDLPSLSDTEIESADIDVDGYLQKVEVAIKWMPRWSVAKNSIVLGLFSFSKFLMFRDLDVETWPQDEQPSEHPIISALFHKGFSEPEPRLDAEDDLDEHLRPQETHHVVDADGSQTLAIVDVDQGRNLVVQGPPGTGKSQTITNIIAEALGHDRTVLFVSEKMAALEVVKRRLDAVGIGTACLELHSHKTTKKNVLDELQRTLELGRPRLREVESGLDTLATLRERLNAYCNAVNEPVGESGVSPYRAYGELALFHCRNEGVALPKPDIPSIQRWSGQDYQRREEIVRDLQARLTTTGVPMNHPFWGVQRRSILPADLERLRTALPSTQRSLSRLVDAASALAGALGLAPPDRVGDAEAQWIAADRVLEAPNLTDVNLEAPDWRTQGEGLEALTQDGAKLSLLLERYGLVLNSSAWTMDLAALRQKLEDKGRRWWWRLSSEYRQAKEELAGLCQGQPPSGLRAQLEMIEAVEQSKRLMERLAQGDDTLGHRVFGSQWQREASDWTALSNVTSWVLELYADMDSGNIPEDIIGIVAQARPTDGLREHVRAVKEAAEEHGRNVGGVVEILDFDTVKRFGTREGLGRHPFAAQQELMAAWVARPNEIHDITSFNVISDTCQSEGLGQLLSVAESWSQASSHLLDLLRQAWYESVLEQAFAGREALKTFDGASHQQAAERFRSLDKTSLNHNRARLVYSHWEKLPKGDAGGQLGILRRQFALKKRHLPIRKLLQQAGNAVQAIKPVFMMSPLSIAAYIAPGSLHFDLVVFDEASQIRPVEALGAILRGRQVVVMGDDKQLPPTRFFDSIAQGDDQDDDSPTANIESILGLFASKGAPQRMLRWHYRSRHESLIAVSNQEFYDNSLLIFPSPDASGEEVGLGFHHLANTVYDRGRSSTNLEEAKAVAQAVMDHARDYPDMTLGVAAFSVKQMQVILDQLELLRQENPIYEGFFNSHPHEPFFVKNLETVQGDERDVIIISVGYGRDASGRLDMNFGPLNGDGGERRLNVLITRAKQRCEVFTNLEADDIDLRRTNARGVRALKTFLAYCQHGTLDIPVEHAHEGANPFEEAVASALRGEGYDVRHLVGAAGYFIDLAVVDPAKPGRFLLGIECDGASYHSARSARDRDRLRQQVLEGMGWKLYRIWSTDWFRQPQRELQRAVQAIEKAKEARKNQGSAPPSVKAPQAAVFREENHVGAKWPDAAPMYDVANVLPPASRRWDLRDALPQQLAPFVEKVVIVESPVHTSEVSRRIADAFGTKLGSRIQGAIDNAIATAVRCGKVRREGSFLWRVDMKQPVLRDRSKLPPSSRKIPMIPPEEMALAVCKVVAGAYGIDREQVSGAALKLLGFGKASNGMRSQIEPVITRMIAEGILEQQGSQLQMPSNQAG